MSTPPQPVTPRYLSPVRVSEKDLDQPREKSSDTIEKATTSTFYKRPRSPSPPPLEDAKVSHPASFTFESKRQRTVVVSLSPSASRTSRLPSPPPRSPPRELKRPGAARVSQQERSRDLASPAPLRSPPRQLKRPGAGSRVARPAPPRSPSPPRPQFSPISEQRPGSRSGSAVPSQDADVSRDPQRRQSPERSPQRAAHSSAGTPHHPNSDHRLVTEHYNSVKQYGVKWRSEQSNIRGLRSFNNWIKSCIINKFTYFPEQRDGLNVLDIGCGKGGDLQKWRSVRPSIRTYIGLDPADVSIDNARDRFEEMVSKNRGRRPFNATFGVKDCFGESIGQMEVINRVGFASNPDDRFNQGGFDIVTMMFCLHYAFESEQKARQMLANVSGSLKKGGRFMGVIPNSDIIKDQISRGRRTWGNDIYSVEFRDEIPKDGVFRPPFGWKYYYKLDEAVNNVPEYVVPFEAFRALAEDYNLELQYRRTFKEVWHEERTSREMSQMAHRMRVVGRDGRLSLTREEEEAAFFYQAFCFYKV